MLSYEDCSLVLLNYARPDNMRRILAEHLKLPWNDIVVIDHQEYGPCWDEEPLFNECSRVTIVVPHYNQMSYGRCTGALMARKNTICTQDDDYLVKPDGWRRLFAAYNPEDAHIRALCPEDVIEDARLRPYTSLGYGSMFDRRWTQWAWGKLLSPNGSPHNELMKRKADKAWTAYWGKAQLIPAWTDQMTRLMGKDWTYSETDENAIHLQPTHHIESALILAESMMARSCSR